MVQQERAPRTRIAFGILALVTGVGIHMGALALVEQIVLNFPRVTDVVAERLPVVDFGVWGELAFVALIIWFAISFFHQPGRDLPRLLTLVGCFYAVRGLFLLLLPIGAPVGGPLPDERFLFYPYADHAFFPGGHIGVLTLFGLSLRERRMRSWFLFATLVFGLGSVLARAHYTADIVGGMLIAFTLFSSGRRWFPGTQNPRRKAGGDA